MKMLSDIGVVLQYDLIEALRSRRLYVVFALFIFGAVSVSGLFILTLSQAEALYEKHSPGSTEVFEEDFVDVFANSEAVGLFVTRLVRGDEMLAAELLTYHPLALFYGWTALGFIPLLVLLTSCDSITADIASGSCRFSLVRTSRLAWCTGKFGGQLALLLVALCSGGLIVALIGNAYLKSVEAGPFLVEILYVSMFISAYGIPYLGLFMGISQLTRSVNIARMISLVTLIGFWLINVILSKMWLIDDNKAAYYIQHALPGIYKLNLWHPDLHTRAAAVAALALLGAVYFLIGHQVLARRDV